MQEPAVLVIGSGAAGLSCALRLADGGRRVCVVSKGPLAGGSTLWAQGGISAVLDAEDSLENHIRDTHAAGADPATLALDMPVALAFETIGDGFRLPVFTPAAGA